LRRSGNLDRAKARVRACPSRDLTTEIIETWPLRILILGIGAGGTLYMYLKAEDARGRE